MDTKQFFISVAFAITTTMLINYFIIDRFFNKDTQEIKSGQAFHVNAKEQMNRPLEKEVNFLDEDIINAHKKAPSYTEIVTPLCDIIFSSQGAVIEKMICKQVSGHVEKAMEIVSPDPENFIKPFLVAFDVSTPLQYQLIDSTYEAGVHTLTYQSKSTVGTVTKKFKIFDAHYVIDLTLTIDPVDEQTPRLYLSAPRLKGSERTAYSDIALINKHDSDKLQRLKPAEFTDKAFATPTLCGAADRYFVNALFESNPVFAQRCYFTVENDSLECIIEGPRTTAATTWTCSYYCGPKEYETLVQADQRLTELLDYGWFAPIARPMLFLLKLIYRFVHNFGFAIIILTVLLNLVLLPLTLRGEKSLHKAADFSKKMQYIDQKYKHDKERLAHEKAELVSKHGSVDALGCSSFLIQMVFFIGLNKVLSSSIELYKAPFYWIKDLSLTDPYYMLPALVFVGILLPALMTSGDIRQKATTIAIGLFVGGLMAQLSAGLVLFVLANVASRMAITQTKKLFA